MSGQAAMPERIGRFHIRSMLGRGAMGIVYLGHDEEIDRLVAIKLIRADLLDTEEREGYLKRFRNEAKIAGRCMHANIVGLYDFAMHDENPYLVMEYVDGIGLQQFFPRGTQRPAHEVIHVALQVLDALHYAHGRSIVHRDIKPANILMMPDLSLKITDFGISRLTSMEMTVTPLLIGTPSYMSPEQCLGSALDGRNDLFSLGCVLYEMTAGERAFSGVNYTDTIFSIVNKPHVPLSQLRDDLPPGFSDAIDKALAKSPDQRYPDAASFARVLDDIARESRMPRSGMPPVIADTGRMHAVSQPTMRMMREAAETEPTISAPMTEADAKSPPTIATPHVPMRADEDPDATLKRTLRIRLPFTRQAPSAAQAREAAISPREAEPLASPTLVANNASQPGTDVLVADTGSYASDNVRHDEDARLTDDEHLVSDHPADADETGSLSFTPGAHFSLPTPVGETERARIVDCLAAVIGPIAPLLARRVEQPGMSAVLLAEALAGHVRHESERHAFQRLLRRELPASFGAANAS